LGRYKNETTPWGKLKTIKLSSVYTSRQYGIKIWPKNEDFRQFYEKIEKTMIAVS
jgi:hypothetical protein